MLILLCIGFLLIILVEVPPLVLGGQKKELRAFWGLLAVSFLFSVGMVQRWPMPNPTPVLDELFRPIATALGLR